MTGLVSAAADLIFCLEERKWPLSGLFCEGFYICKTGFNVNRLLENLGGQKGHKEARLEHEVTEAQNCVFSHGSAEHPNWYY
jgi:hypothetical protein